MLPNMAVDLHQCPQGQASNTGGENKQQLVFVYFLFICVCVYVQPNIQRYSFVYMAVFLSPLQTPPFLMSR